MNNIQRGLAAILVNHSGRPEDISKPRWRAIVAQVKTNVDECRTTGTGNCRCVVEECLLGYPDTVAVEEKKRREDSPVPEELPKSSRFRGI